MTDLPKIGITIDLEVCPKTSQPQYTSMTNCSEIIRKAGGLPILLPIEPELVSSYLDMIDGVIVTGGRFDIDPAMYGEPNRQKKLVLKKSRTYFEKKLIEGALERDMPLIGICNGMQLLAVVMGLSLIQDIPNEVKGCIEHMQEAPYTFVCHDVDIKANSILYELMDKLKLQVNSVHHQSVKTLSPHVISTATSCDGIIEAIEVVGQSFCLGFQWHPEYLDQPAIFSGLVQKSMVYNKKK